MRLLGLGFEAFVTGFSGAAMPGPLLVICIWLSVALGFWAGPALIVGHGLLEILLVLAIAGGIGRCLSRPDAPLVRGIGIVGGLMLILMAADMLRSLPQLSLRSIEPVGTQQQHPIVAGFVFSAANPYFWIWWATIGLGLVTKAVAQERRPGLVAFYSGHILSDFAWYSLVSGLVAAGGQLLPDGVYRTIIGALALMLLFFGARFLLLGLRPPPIEPDDAAE